MREAGEAGGSAAATVEETGYVPSGKGWLYAFACRPEGSGNHPGVAIMGPFAEERKSSLRPLAELARELARAGFVALRVDYRGTGDSSGASAEISFDSMVDDACAAVTALRGEHGCGRVALVGLRLGATVALSAARRSRAEALALVEPVVDGRSYVRELERAGAIRRMLTRGASPDGPAAAGPGAEQTASDRIDLDGVELGRALLAEIAELDLLRAARELAAEVGVGKIPALVLQVGARRKLREEYARLAEALGDVSRAEVVVAEPFWLQADYVDPQPASGRIVEFLGSAVGAIAGGGSGAGQ